MRLGTEDALKLALQHLGFSGWLNTAFIERVNLTVRHGIAALARRTWATSQQASHLLAYLLSGGEPTTISYALMHHCEWPLRSRENEVARWWRNATGSILQPWQPREPTDDGRHGKFCAIPYLRCQASSGEHEGREMTPCERAGSGLGKGKTGTGVLTDRMKHPLWSVD